MTSHKIHRKNDGLSSEHTQTRKKPIILYSICNKEWNFMTITLYMLMILMCTVDYHNYAHSFLAIDTIAISI